MLPGDTFDGVRSHVVYGAMASHGPAVGSHGHAAANRLADDNSSRILLESES
jgi:hypothetical protein